MSKILTARQAAAIAAEVQEKDIIEKQFKQIMEIIEIAAREGKDEICYEDIITEENVHRLIELGYSIEDSFVEVAACYFIGWRNK